MRVCLHLSFSKDWGECRTCRIVAYWPPRVFQSRWRWRRLLPRDPGLSAPFALPLCYPGCIPARCLWQWGGCLALPCQPDVVRYRWVLCCLHVPRVLPTISGKHLLVGFYFYFYIYIFAFLVGSARFICFIDNLVYQWAFSVRYYLSFLWIRVLVYYRAFRGNLAPSHIHLFAFSEKGSSEWATSSSAPWRWWRLAHSAPLCCLMQRRWGRSACLFTDRAQMIMRLTCTYFAKNSAACSLMCMCVLL